MVFMRLKEITSDKQLELVENYINEKIKHQIDDVEKLSVTILTKGFEQYLYDKCNLHFKVSSYGFFLVLEPLMEQLGYQYAGKASKLRFIEKNKIKYQYDRVTKTLNIRDFEFLIESHRFFQKVINE